MTQSLQFGANFDPNSVFVDDVYLEVVPPAAYLTGVPTSVDGKVGTADWGEVNVAKLISDPQGVLSYFGATVDADDIHDLCWDLTVSLNQNKGGGNSLAIQAVRVTDGTDTASSFGLLDSASPAENATVGGTLTTGNVVNLKFSNSNFSGGFYTLHYTVGGGDTTTTLLATSLKNAVNADSTLIAAGITATSLAAVISFTWPYTFGAIVFSKSVNGVSTAVVGGSAVADDVVYITVLDAGLVGGAVTVSYTVLVSDTTTSIATGLKNAINASAALTAIGVTATNATVTISITSLSRNQTTYTKDTTGASATITLGGGPTETITYANLALTGLTLTAVHTGTKGSEIKATISAGSKTNTAVLVITPFAGGGPSEIFDNLPTTTTLFWAAARDAINLGQGASRPPSNWVVASAASGSAVAPQFGTFTLAGGTSGRSVSSGDLIGSETGDVSGGPSGMYALAADDVEFPPSVFSICGLTDSSVFPTMAAFAIQANTMALATFAAGQTVDQVVASKLAIGIADFHFAYIYQWCYLYDSFNQIVRLCPPLAVASGSIACLAPEESPFNKTVQLVIGTERQSQQGGRTGFSTAEIAKLTKAGIMFLSNPIPGARAFGFRNGYNSIGNKAVNSFVEYTRLTNYLVQSNGQLLGQFEGRLQGQEPDDPLRAEISAALINFYSGLKTSRRIDDYSVICNNTNNSFASIAAHAVRVSENIRYLSSVCTILAQIQGGTTVQTVTNQVASTIPGT